MSGSAWVTWLRNRLTCCREEIVQSDHSINRGLIIRADRTAATPSMKVCAKLSILLCLLPLVLSYPLIKGKPNDTGKNLHSSPDPAYNVRGIPDRCGNKGFDAVTLDDKGVMHYFRGDSVWLGYQGPTQYINETWAGLTGPIDAAFRNHNKDNPLEHQRIYLFKGSQVWSYSKGQLMSGFPCPISQEFPGIPDHLDAAVECHRGECRTDSVIFFKGDTVYIYSPQELPAVKLRHWPALGGCTAASRWTDSYYCFHGVSFTRFNPVTGENMFSEWLDSRDYFIKCPGRGHGHDARQNATLMSIMDRCSNRSFEAFCSDDNSRTYAFRGGYYLRIDSKKDGWHAWPLNHTWPNLVGVVDAAFAYKNNMHFIQGSQVMVYSSDQLYVPVAGYPQPIKPIAEAWEVTGVMRVDAAFTCPHSNDLYLIRGNKLTKVDLITQKRSGDWTIIHPAVDAAMCNNQGLYLFIGPSYYHYQNIWKLLSSKVTPTPGNIKSDFLDC